MRVIPSAWSWNHSVVACWLLGYWYTAALGAVATRVLYPLPWRPSGVNQASGAPSDKDESSPPWRWTTAGIGPVKGLKEPIWLSGSAQWMVWSIVRYLRSTGSRGSEFTYVTVVALPRCASMVAPGHEGAAVPTW